VTAAWSVLASGFGILEAPTVADDGSIYFSDITGGRLYRLAPGADEPTVEVPRRRGVCIACFALTGELLRVLVVPARRVTSVCFGRVDRTVYVTTEDNTTDAALAGCLLVSDIDVAGAAAPAAAI